MGLRTPQTLKSQLPPLPKFNHAFPMTGLDLCSCFAFSHIGTRMSGKLLAEQLRVPGLKLFREQLGQVEWKMAYSRANYFQNTLTAKALKFFISIAFMALIFAMPARAIEGPVLSFMNKIADSVISANHNKSKNELEKIIRENVDVEQVGNYSLGSYIKKLSKNDVSNYYDGVVNFMSRYAATKSEYYQVSDIVFYKPRFKGKSEIIIKSKIKMASGQKYSVKWRVSNENGQFKLRDASIYGFWIMPFQRRLFRSYVRKNNNDVNALLLVLGQ